MSIETLVTERGLLQRIFNDAENNCEPLPPCFVRALLRVTDNAIGEAVRSINEAEAAVAINKDYEENLGRMILDPRHIAEVFACDFPGEEGSIALSVGRDGKLVWYAGVRECTGSGGTLDEALAAYRVNTANTKGGHGETSH